MVAEAVLTSTHNLCFGAKIRKLDIPLYTPVLLYKSGAQGGIRCTDVFSLMPVEASALNPIEIDILR